jgi:hypothetical protein
MNVKVIESAPAAGGGDLDFSQYGIGNAYEAGRSAVVNYFAQSDEQRPQRLRAAA